MEGSSVTRPSGIYSPDIVEDIQVKAELGRYRIRGFGTLRQRPLPSLDEPILSSIAVSDGELFIRTYKNLWCIGKK